MHRQALEIPQTPLRTPLSASAFAEHLPIAVDAGAQLGLVLVRAEASRRGRRRLEAALRASGGFAYELPGGHAVLLPGFTGWEAFKAALALRRAARAHVDAGLAMLEPGDTPQSLFERATEALELGGVQVAPPRVVPLQVN